MCAYSRQVIDVWRTIAMRMSAWYMCSSKRDNAACNTDSMRRITKDTDKANQFSGLGKPCERKQLARGYT